METPKGAPIIFISKIDAAKRQLEAAIHLYILEILTQSQFIHSRWLHTIFLVTMQSSRNYSKCN